MGIVQGAYARSFQEGLADIGTDIIGSCRPVMEADEVVIMVITGADVQGSAIVRLVLIDQRSVVIRIIESGVATERELVGCKIAESLKGVLAVEPVGYSQVGIMEISAAAGIVTVLGQHPEDPV